MVRTRRQTASVRGALIHSAIEHPVVWDFVGKGRYLQAAVSKFFAQLYRSRFDSITSKNLSNIAAETGALPLLCWTQSIGCNWGDSVFISAIQGGRTETLEYLVDNDCPIPQGEDACTCAAKEGKLQVLIWLRRRNAAWGEAVCTQAAAGGHLEVLEWAVYNTCSWNTKEVTEKAAGAGHLHILKWAKNLFGAEMFTSYLCSWAGSGGHLDVLQWLRSWNCPWNQGCIWLAASEGRVDVFQWAKANGCPYDVNEEAVDGLTLMDLAIKGGHVEIAKILLADGANVHHTNAAGAGYLHLSVALGRDGIVRELISAGANVNAHQGRNGLTPLLAAIASGNIELTNMLCDAGADIESSGGEEGDGVSPLIVAVDGNHVEIINLLLERGAKVNRVCSQTVALHIACQKGFPEAALALIRGGADMNMRMAENGTFPLLFACVVGSVKLVEVLLKNGAGVDVRGPDGLTPLITAIIKNDVDVVAALIAGGCDVNLSVDVQSPLGVAICMKNLDMVSLIVRAGADLTQTTYGHRPLHLAESQGLVEIGAFLRGAGAT